jgi:hypothetical protein
MAPPSQSLAPVLLLSSSGSVSAMNCQVIGGDVETHHADEGVVDSLVSVRVVLAQHLADDAGALAERLVGSKPHVVHGIQDAPVARKVSEGGASSSKPVETEWRDWHGSASSQRCCRAASCVHHTHAAPGVWLKRSPTRGRGATRTCALASSRLSRLAARGRRSQTLRRPGTRCSPRWRAPPPSSGPQAAAPAGLAGQRRHAL